MKRRSSFVSNSSSCSFIILEGKPKRVNVYDNVILTPKNGEYVFDNTYDIIEYNDFYSKLNFAVMQAQYADTVRWFNMIIDVVKDFLGVDYFINQLFIDEFKNNMNKIKKYIGDVSLDEFFDEYEIYFGSIAYEYNSKSGFLVRIFDSKENLLQFLFSKDSKLVIGDEIFQDDVIKMYHLDRYDYFNIYRR